MHNMLWFFKNNLISERIFFQALVIQGFRCFGIGFRALFSLEFRAY